MQQLRTQFLKFLKHYFNPLTKWMVRSSIGPFAIVRHIGRRSGKQYETPIVVRPTENGFVIELTYGKEVDWFKNVQANNGCTIVWHRKEYVVNGVRPLDTQTGLQAFPLPVQIFLRIMRRTHFAKLVFDPAQKKEMQGVTREEKKS